MIDEICRTTAELMHRKDRCGLLLFDMKVREWLIKRHGRRVNPELIAELDHTIRRLQALVQRSAS